MEEQQVQKPVYVSIQKQIEQHNKKARKIQSSLQNVNLDFVTTYGMAKVVPSNQLIIVGVSLIIKDVQLKTYTHLTKEGGLHNVTALAAVMTSKGLLVAVGESTDKREQPAQISIYWKNKWHTLTDGVQKGIIKNIQLNENSNYCVSRLEYAQTNFIDFWNYKNEKLLSQTQNRLNITKMSIHPKTPKNLIFSGNQYFRTWELMFQSKQLKESPVQLVPMKIEKETKFLDHAWIPFNNPILVVLITNNKVFIIQNDQLKKTVTLEFMTSNMWPVEVKEITAETLDEYQGLNNMLDNIVVSKPNFDRSAEVDKARAYLRHASFSTLTVTKKGFIIGGEQGFISLFEVDNQLQCQNSLNFQVKIQGQERTLISQLVCSQNDSLISIISTQDNHISYSILNTFQLDSDKQPIEPFFASGYHNKRVTYLTCSHVKSLYASSSSDKSVKFWSYQEEMKGLFTISFDQEPNCISMHSTGVFIAIAFQMNLKVFAILNQSLVLLKELVLGNCNLCSYSHKGHFLVANESQTIHIFEAINYNLLVSLDKHLTPIKTMSLSEDDLTLVSQCHSGYINVWDIQKEIELFKAQQNFMTRQNLDHQPEQNQIPIQLPVFNCFVYYSYFKETPLFITASDSSYLSIYKQDLNNLIVELPIQDNIIITSMLVSRTLKLFFCGTNKGTVRISIWPLFEESLEIVPLEGNKVRFQAPSFNEISIHSLGIVSLQISHDGMYLMCGVEDGSISIIKLEQKREEGVEGSATRSEDRIKMTNLINDMMFIHQSKVIEVNENIKKLNFEVVKSEQTVMIETQKIQMLFQQKLQKIQQNIDQLTKEFQEQEKDMEQVFNSQYQHYSDIFANDQKNYESQMKEMSDENERQVVYETERNKELELEIEQMNLQHQQYFQSQLEQHKKDLKNLRLNYQRKCEQIQLKYSNVVNNAKNFGTAFISRLDKQEQEYNRELEDQVNQLKEQIAQIISINYDLSKQNNKLQEDNDELMHKNENLKVKFNEQLNLHANIVSQNLKNDEAMVKQQHQLLERIQVIESKDETCREARDEQINLENFRYLLDQKIKMLQNEKTQILEKLKEKEQNLKKMFQELVKQTDKNDKKYIKFQNLERELSILNKNLNSSKDKNASMKAILQKFQSTILQIMKTPDQIGPISRKLYEMIDQQSNQSAPVSSRTDYDLEGEDINLELQKQGRWMNRKLWLIDETNKKLKEIREENVDQILNQNTKLIEECNILRAENERHKKLTRNVQKMLLEARRMKNKKSQKKPNVKKLVRKYEENTIQLKSQNNQLNNLQQSINDLLKSDSEDHVDSTKFPSINKQKQVSQSMTMNQTKEQNKQLPILIEESL